MREAQIAELLPEVFQRTLHPDGPLAGYLAAMAALLSPAEKILDDLDFYFDPLRAEDRFVALLARWVDMDALLEDREAVLGAGGERDTREKAVARRLSSGLGRLRELVAGAARLARMRGTTEGLRRFLEIATGCQGFSIVEETERPFHIEIIAPAAAAAHHSLVERIIAREKPAYVTCAWRIVDDA